jgi:diaminopimelate epimerase
MLIPFLKMHGAGNDFVVFDAREKPLRILPEQAKRLCDRHFGIGCDQLVILEKSAKADVFMRIYNADGGEVSTCGNATRCIGFLQLRETNKQCVSIETKSGVLEAKAHARGVTVDMGAPRLGWQEIPLSKEMDTLSLPIELGAAKNPVAVSMGNPHAVFFVKDLANFPVQEIGAKFEHHSLFPERANIGFAEVISPEKLKLRVFERGAGETLACGSGACAALVAAVRRGLTGRKATLALQGGELLIEWLPDSEGGHVLMTGAAEIVFTGSVEI